MPKTLSNNPDVRESRFFIGKERQQERSFQKFTKPIVPENKNITFA
jgi:hypothetical protein